MKGPRDCKSLTCFSRTDPLESLALASVQTGGDIGKSGAPDSTKQKITGSRWYLGAGPLPLRLLDESLPAYSQDPLSCVEFCYRANKTVVSAGI